MATSPAISGDRETYREERWVSFNIPEEDKVTSNCGPCRCTDLSFCWGCMDRSVTARVIIFRGQISWAILDRSIWSTGASELFLSSPTNRHPGIPRSPYCFGYLLRIQQYLSFLSLNLLLNSMSWTLEDAVSIFCPLFCSPAVTMTCHGAAPTCTAGPPPLTTPYF